MIRRTNIGVYYIFNTYFIKAVYDMLSVYEKDYITF